MSRALIVVTKDQDRERAALWAKKAPTGTRIEYRQTKRTLPQNDLMWALLTEVARQVEWYGERLTPTDWKDVFTASLKKARVVPGLDPGSFVVLGMRTSEMSKEELGMLIELIYSFGAERDVDFGDQRRAA